MALPTEPSEQKRLVELAYLGEWMINAHHDPEHQDDAARETLQHLLGQMKTSPGIGRDVETGEYYLEEAWVERLYNQYVADYDDHVFWDELTERLAQRDLARLRGLSVDQINRDDDLQELRPLEEAYRRELEVHGIDHLELSEDDA